MEISSLDNFDKIDVSDFKTVKRLLLKRMEVQSVLSQGLQSNFLGTASEPLSSEEKYQILEVYEIIDKIIIDCNFKEKRLVLLDFISKGYTISEICKSNDEYKASASSKMLNAMVKAINEKSVEYKRKEVSM